MKLKLIRISAIVTFNLIFILEFTNCAILDSDKIENMNHSLLEQNIPKEDSEKLYPVTPNGVMATQWSSEKTYSDKIIISWNIPEGVCYVRVFWFEAKEVAIEKENHTKQKLLAYELLYGNNYSQKISYHAGHFEHQNLLIGSEYYYLVKFYNENGFLLGCSTTTNGSTAHLPYNVDASKDSREGNIKITWEWKENWEYEKFYIYRANTRNGQYTKIAELGKKSNFLRRQIKSVNYSYNDKISEEQHGEPFYYKISTVFNNKESLFGNITVGKTVKIGAPEKPKNLTVTKKTHRNIIKLKWDALEKAPSRYLVYTKIGTQWSSSPIDVGLEISYDYIVNPLTDKQIIFYVCGENDLGEGIPSDYEIGSIIPFVKQTTADFLVSDEKVKISWDAVTLIDLNAKYKVYRSDDTILDSSDVCLTGNAIATTIFEDTTGIEGSLYYYFVTVFNTISNEEGATNLYAQGARGTIPIPEFSVTKSLENITLNFENSKPYLTMSIKASRPSYKPKFYGRPMYETQDGAVPQNYEDTLRYKVNPNFSYSNYLTVESLKSSSQWIDNNTTPGINKYIVRFKYNGTLQSEWSEIKEGWREITDEEFLNEFLMTIAKSQFKMVNIHQTGMTPGQSEGPINGDKNGYLYYTPKIHIGGTPIYGGSGASVPITYTDYLDYYLTINDEQGNPQKTIANLSMGQTEGCNYVDGIYKGKITFNLALMEGKKCAGNPKHSGSSYKVVRIINGNQKPEVSIPWDFDRTNIENYLSNYPY